MRNYVILIDRATLEQRNAVTAFVKGKVKGYWHHFQDSWLLIDDADEWEPKTLREALVPLIGDANILVLKVSEIDHPGWSGRGPARMFPWLKKNWISKKKE